MYRLQQLAAQADLFPDTHLVSIADEGACTWAQFQEKSAAWLAALQPLTGQRVALYHGDTLEFAAALLALWRLGKTPVLPASPHVDDPLRQCCTQFAGTFTGVASIGPAARPTGFVPTGITLREFDTALVVFTSGSSGTPVAIEKSFQQLDAELATWEASQARIVAGAVFTGTVSHQHIYGLLFRLLWPLCAGHPFVSRAREYWEAVFLDSREHDSLVLITSPAHLDRMPPEDMLQDEWQRLGECCRMIFSSGAPLSELSAKAAQQRLQKDVVEVYGSSETGGVAWRQQRVAPHWQCLRNVAVSQEQGLLQIQSPHLPDTEWFQTADRCEMRDDRSFLLLGRSDKLVKVGGKRISLTAVENLLCQHPWVRQCRVISLPVKDHRLAAVVCLNAEGNKKLVDSDKKTLNQALQQRLESIDRLARPRYWRYLSDLPRDTQGKVTQASLERLFDTDEVKFAEVVERSVLGENRAGIRLFIPMNLYYFRGHFPGTPILPGVVQIHWAVHYGRELFDIDLSFSHLEAIKFQQVIRPHEVVNLQLEYNREKGKLVFSYGGEGCKYSSGRVVFAADALE